MRARQVLIDLDWSAGASALRDGDVSAIRDRVNKALSTMQGTLKHQARVVTKLHNGGILLELNSNEAVEWFQDSKNLPLQPPPIHLHQATPVQHHSPICPALLPAG